MHFDYKQFRIDVTPLAFGDRYFARARIYRCDCAGKDQEEVRWSGDTSEYPDETIAANVARQWAIAWIDDDGR
ncbi:hypothetical protein QCE63_17565 [Caballeronia sp. LZ065]|uniref:hypothetical protein n=1 Tax=Caballeronia sp. LZ065 TaxID=3038571 RepID=UPI00285B9A9E|nr:hypothetical protein [Caballeronia sp. LZ065]MDR5781216.1 hypothetical protein [Caballeronia sp. LZ065]